MKIFHNFAEVTHDKTCKLCIIENTCYQKGTYGNKFPYAGLKLGQKGKLYWLSFLSFIISHVICRKIFVVNPFRVPILFNFYENIIARVTIFTNSSSNKLFPV